MCTLDFPKIGLVRRFFRVGLNAGEERDRDIRRACGGVEQPDVRVLVRSFKLKRYIRRDADACGSRGSGHTGVAYEQIYRLVRYDPNQPTGAYLSCGSCRYGGGSEVDRCVVRNMKFSKKC